MYSRQRNCDSRDLGGSASMAGALLSLSMLWAPAVHSTISATMTLGMEPTTLNVGQYGVGLITITNTNSGADQGLTNIVDLIEVRTACTAVPCDAPHPTAYWLAPDPFGYGVGCVGVRLSATKMDPAKGLWRLTPNTPLALGQGAKCNIQFIYKILNVPATDSGTVPLQTVSVVTVVFHGNGSTSTPMSASAESPFVSILPGCSADFDGDGRVDALTDGLLLLRAMFGLTGTTVTSNAVGPSATRKSWSQIAKQLNENCGTNFSAP